MGGCTTALHLLLTLNADAQRDGWQLRLIQGRSGVRRLFEVTATTDQLPFMPAGQHR